MAEPFAPRVLIVDDESHVRAFLKLVVHGLGTREILEAGDGPNALLLYRQWNPDLVLLDFNLPGDDGLAILEKLLAADPDANVVMLTAVASREVVEKCAILGALHYIRKDTPPDQIAAILRRLWAELHESPEPSA